MTWHTKNKGSWWVEGRVTEAPLFRFGLSVTAVGGSTIALLGGMVMLLCVITVSILLSPNGLVVP